MLKKDKEGIRARLISIRKELDLSMDAMGQSAGISRQSVNSWEKNGTTPDWFSLENMKNSLNLNPKWVMTGEGDKFINKDMIKFMSILESPNFNIDEVLEFALFRASKEK